MQHLSLNTFLAAGPDRETNQFLVLSGLRSYYQDFMHNRLYPALAELTSLLSALNDVVQQQTGLKQHMPQELKSIDLANKRLVFEDVNYEKTNFELVIELITWALPLIGRAVEEGRRIHDFVDENLVVEEVGLVPAYREEGYFFIPENRLSMLHVMRYEVSLFSSERDRYRTLKTKLLRSLGRQPFHRSPESIKLELVEQHHDLPNPATFHFETDLDFPFSETILPVAKRKLMARLAA
jgi:hypothetical protein